MERLPSVPSFMNEAFVIMRKTSPRCPARRTVATVLCLTALMPLSSCGARGPLPSSAPLTVAVGGSRSQVPVSATPPAAASATPDPAFLQVETSVHPAV